MAQLAADASGEARGADGPVRGTPFYRLGRFATASYLRVVHRLRIEGGERLPSRGGVLVVSNHQSFLDIPVIAATTRRHVCFVARDTLARSRVLAWIMRQSEVVLVRRDQADRAALRAMIERLELGDCVAVFPEGTRTADGALGRFRGGALLAARQAGVPLVPVGIRGALDAWPRGARVPRPRRIGVRVGEPLDPRDPDALERARDAVGDLIGSGRYDERPTGDGPRRA